MLRPKPSIYIYIHFIVSDGRCTIFTYPSGRFAPDNRNATGCAGQLRREFYYTRARESVSKTTNYHSSYKPSSKDKISFFAIKKKKTRSKIASSSPPFCKQQCVLSGVNEKTDRFLRKSPLERGLMEEERGGRQASLHVVIKRTRRQARAPRNRNPKPARIIIYSSRCASLLDVA